MSRNIDPLVASAAKQTVVRPVLLCRLDIESGEVLVCSAPFHVSYDWNDDAEDEVFLGVGEFGTVSQVEEGAEVRAYSLQLTLSGVPPENISTALEENYRGRDCRLWLALLDEGHQVIGTPYLTFRGRMDTMDIELGGEDGSTITVVANSRLADWDRPRIRRYTNEDQQAEYPGDKGLEFVPQMVEREIIWGTG